MISAVIFDMDDLMINSYPVHIMAANGALKKYGHSLSEIPEDIRKDFLGKRVIDSVKAAREYFKIPVTAEELYTEREKIFLELIKDKLEPMPGLFRIIETLEKEKIDMAIGSSGTMNYIKLVLEKLKLSDKFKIIVSGEDVEKGKPDPATFLIASERLGKKPEECLVIEDATNGIVAAKRAGMKAIGVENPYTPKQDLSKADMIVESLGKITTDIIREL
jgi:HAD superfamily hydrolase (TIGR01509 family)